MDKEAKRSKHNPGMDHRIEAEIADRVNNKSIRKIRTKSHADLKKFFGQ